MYSINVRVRVGVAMQCESTSTALTEVSSGSTPGLDDSRLHGKRTGDAASAASRRRRRRRDASPDAARRRRPPRTSPAPGTDGHTRRTPEGGRRTPESLPVTYSASPAAAARREETAAAAAAAAAACHRPTSPASRQLSAGQQRTNTDRGNKTQIDDTHIQLGDTAFI